VFKQREPLTEPRQERACGCRHSALWGASHFVRGVSNFVLLDTNTTKVKLCEADVDPLCSYVRCTAAMLSSQYADV